jgi:precorrin-8X/cobalt-precorrin-8 methylmutase
MDDLSKYGIILIGHGSRKETYNQDLEVISKYISRKLNAKVELAYNEYSSPNWRDVIKEFINEGYSNIIIGLAFLGRGNHVYNDIMGEMGVKKIGEWEKTFFNGKEASLYLTEPVGPSVLIGLALYLRILRALNVKDRMYIDNPNEIEENSISIISKYLEDVEDEKVRRIIAKVIFASGNPELRHYVYVSEDAVEAGKEALNAESEILADVKMVASGIRWSKVSCYIDNEDVRRMAKSTNKTRAAMGIRYGAGEGGKIIVIGNSPTALIEAIRLIKEGKDFPLIISTPPGFTNATEAKEELIKLGIPSIVLRGTYGGSGIATAVTNELISISSE